MSEMSRHDVPCEVSFPGFGIGMTIEEFQIEGILKESLNSVVRYAIALGPKCFWWKMLSLSGPKAFVLLQLLMARVTRSVVNVTVVSLGFRRTSLDTNRVSREELCLPSFDVANYLLNRLAICFGESTWEPLMVMASFSAVCFNLPSSALIVRYSLEEVDLWSKVSTNVLHLSRLCLFFAWLISSFIYGRVGEVGSRDLRSSRALIISKMSAGKAPVWSSLCFQRGCVVMLLSRLRHVESSLFSGNQLGQALCSLSFRCPCCILAVSHSSDEEKG